MLEKHPGVGAAFLTTVACAGLYALFFAFNHLLFSQWEFALGVNWVFLPSGLRLSLVLIFLEWGAVGIALSSMAISWWGYEMSAANSLVTGCISGLAPWLARRLCLDWLRLNPDIQHLNPRQLVQLSVIFSITSPILHQLWYCWNDPSAHFVKATLVMMVGDLLGTLIILCGLRLFVLWLRTRARPTP